MQKATGECVACGKLHHVAKEEFRAALKDRQPVRCRRCTGRVARIKSEKLATKRAIAAGRHQRQLERARA